MSSQPLAHRLSSLDAAFLYLETPEAPLHIGGVSVLDGDVTAASYARLLDARLGEIPRYLQRIGPPPHGLGHPLWEEDPAFDVHRHVLETRLDAPGNDAQLRSCAARLFEPCLDRSRPLWELHVIRGLEGRRTALLTKIHHAMVDGVSGVELMSVLFDRSPDAPVERGARPSRAQQTLRAEVAMLESLWETAAAAAAGARALVSGVAGLVGSWRTTASGAMKVTRALADAAAHPVARLPFNRTLTGRRRLGWLSLPLDQVRTLGQHRGGTVNDVALAVLADGIGRLLGSCGEPAAGRFLRVLVPVNIRREAERGQLGNRVSMVPVEIPFGGDPLARLGHAIARTSAMKQARIADLVGQAAGIGDLLPAWVMAKILPLTSSPAVLEWTASLRSAPFLTANMVCTNVPGPAMTLFGRGHRLVAHYPLVPLGFETGLNCALLTYDNVLYVGLLADAAAIDDLSPLTEHLRSAYNDLRSADAATPHLSRRRVSTAVAPKNRGRTGPLRKR